MSTNTIPRFTVIATTDERIGAYDMDYVAELVAAARRHVGVSAIEDRGVVVARGSDQINEFLAGEAA